MLLMLAVTRAESSGRESLELHSGLQLEWQETWTLLDRLPLPSQADSKCTISSALAGSWVTPRVAGTPTGTLMWMSTSQAVV